MIKNEDIIATLSNINYTDIRYSEGVYYAKNVLGQSRIFKPSLIMKEPIPVYALKTIDSEMMDFDNLTNVKMLLLNVKLINKDTGVIKLIKVKDDFYSLSQEEAELVDLTYSNKEYVIQV